MKDVKKAEEKKKIETEGEGDGEGGDFEARALQIK